MSETNYFNTTDILSIPLKEVLEVTEIFDFEYTVEYFSKKEIEELFKIYYYERTIAFNSVVTFKNMLQSTWRLQLHKYNQLFKAYSKNILDNMDITETENSISNLEADNESDVFEPTIDFGTEIAKPRQTNKNEQNTTATFTNTKTKKGNLEISIAELLSRYSTLENAVMSFFNEVAIKVFSRYEIGG